MSLLGKCDYWGRVVPVWPGDGGTALNLKTIKQQQLPARSSLGREIRSGLESLGLGPQSNSLICFAEGQLLIFNYVSIFFALISSSPWVSGWPQQGWGSRAQLCSQDLSAPPLDLSLSLQPFPWMWE